MLKAYKNSELSFKMIFEIPKAKVYFRFNVNVTVCVKYTSENIITICTSVIMTWCDCKFN